MVLEAVEVARVAAEEHAQIVIDDDPRGPQGAVAVEQTAAGEMLGRCRRERQTVDLHTLPPVELAYLRRVDTPFDQPVADAQRRQKHARGGGEREHRLAVQMVVVVVRQNHAAQRRQVGERNGRRMKAFGTEPPERRCTFGENRIGQPELTAQLEQHGRMPEAIQAAVRRRVELFARQRIDGQGACRRRAVRLVEQHIPHDAQGLADSFDGTRLDVTKALAVMLSRRVKQFTPASRRCQAQHRGG